MLLPYKPDSNDLHQHHESQSHEYGNPSYDDQNNHRKAFLHKKCLLLIAVLIFSAASISIRWPSIVSINNRNHHSKSAAEGWRGNDLLSPKSSQSLFVAEDNESWDNRITLKRFKRVKREEIVQDAGKSINKTKDEETSTKSREPIPKSNTTAALDCEQAAFLEFPPDLFNQFLRSHGFVTIHILVSCYMFYCLAVVCDNYFLPSLEECSHRLGLSDDVAGATFMAAGSSAPELFIALLGTVVLD